MQGATVSKPNSLILDLRHVMEPAQAYVMLSRVQALSQLFIIEDICRRKIYPSPLAIEELERLKTVSLNNENTPTKYSLITSLNIRSLPKHIEDLRNDFKMKQSSIICIQETWCSDEYNNNNLIIDGFELHLTNHGRGKGIATYYKHDFYFVEEVNEDKFQMSKFGCHDFYVINVYRSNDADTSTFLYHLDLLSKNCECCYIVGDFNINFINSSHHIVRWIQNQGFIQLVQSPTHEEGGIIDHVYVNSQLSNTVILHWPYYSDHAGLCIQNSTDLNA